MRILRGEEIRELGAQGLLIRDRFRAGNCEGVSYNLTLGPRYQSITKTEQGYRQISGALTLEPSEAVNVEINEKFNFVDARGRPRYFGVVIANARLLAGGVSHPATMIDPGFRHTTTLTLLNLRNFPSRPFRPGADKIAKLIIIELGLEELPSGWEETPAYMQSGPDDLPVLWSDFHMMPTWQPTNEAVLNALRAVGPRYGPPFDILQSHLLEHRKGLYSEDGSLLSLAGITKTVREDAASFSKTADFLSHRIEALERAQGELSTRISAAAADVAEVQHAQLAEKSQVRQEHRDTRRYWINVIVAIVAAVIGAAVTLLFSFFGVH
jgi:deoxycytidine triphosphate deaminase